MKNSRDQKRAPQAKTEFELMGQENVEENGYLSAPLLDVGQASKYLGVGRKVLYQLIERGEITVVKSGTSTLVEKESLDAFRARGTLT
jgi:excisionase family DNA binding protein